MIKESFLLCGGKGKRFGFDKRFLEIEGIPLYLYQIQKLLPFFQKVTLLCKSGEESLFEDLKIPIIAEKESVSSLLCGLITGLSNSEEGRALFLSVDMPLLPLSAIKFFNDYPITNRPVVPFTEDKMHNGFSIFPKVVLSDLLFFKSKGIFSLKKILPALNTIFLTENELPFLVENKNAFYNINYYEDFLFLQKNHSELKLRIPIKEK